MKKKFVLVLSLVSFVAFLGFQVQESGTFYYAFKEKIPLEEVENKLVIRYSERMSRTTASSALTRSYSQSTQKWEDERTVVLSVDSKTMRNRMIDELKVTSEVVSCHPLFKISTGLEMIISDEFLVKFKAGVSLEKQNEINLKYGVIILKNGDSYQLLKTPKGSNLLEVANKYQESGLVDFSHPNFILQLEKHQQVIPNDPFFINQFTLNNTGQVFNDGHFGIADADIDAPESWAMTMGGNNIVVAVLDQGVSPNHPDLPNARQVRLNGSNFGDGNPNDPSPTGNSNHGNACAGVIAATQNNNEGIAGVCPNCRIMPIRIFNANETGIPANRLADAIDFARNNGADIISNSWGFNSNNPNFQPVIVTAIQAATTQGRVINGVARGCVVLFSASNSARHTQGDNGQVNFPSNVNIAGVITVGASDRNDIQSDYSPTSNPASSNNQIIDIAAPSHRAYPPTAYPVGVVGGIVGETFEAWSIDVPNNAGYNPWPQFTSPGNPSVVPPAVGEQVPNAGINFQSYTGRFGGTSHSCPVVAGIAALMLSANPNLTQQQVFDTITGTANQVGGYVYTNGRSNELGFGRVNACQAVLEAYRVGNSINGSVLVCGNTTYSLQNSPNANRIIWSTNDPNALNINPTTGIATRMNNFNGQITVTATINSGCGATNIARTVWVGDPNITYVPPGANPCSDNPYYYGPSTLGLSYQWTVDNPNVSLATPGNSVNASVLSYNPEYFNITLTISDGSCSTSSTILGYTPGYYCLCFDPSCGGGLGLFAVSPNPASEVISISLDDNEYKNQIKKNGSITYSLTLIDEQGNVRTEVDTSDKIFKWDSSKVPSGTYYLKITYNDLIETKRILIKH